MKEVCGELFPGPCDRSRDDLTKYRKNVADIVIIASIYGETPRKEAGGEYSGAEEGNMYICRGKVHRQEKGGPLSTGERDC